MTILHRAFPFDCVQHIAVLAVFCFVYSKPLLLVHKLFLSQTPLFKPPPYVLLPCIVKNAERP
jgi:hypothetical protein